MLHDWFKRFVNVSLSSGAPRTNIQLEFLRSFLAKHKYVYSHDFEENLRVLKRKHLVDSFLVTNLDGSIVVSSDGNGHTEGIMGTAMLSYIKSELPDSESVLIKRHGHWFMLFPLHKRVFIVKAGSDLSNIELHALALELDTLLRENKHPEKKRVPQVA